MTFLEPLVAGFAAKYGRAEGGQHDIFVGCAVAVLFLELHNPMVAMSVCSDVLLQDVDGCRCESCQARCQSFLARPTRFQAKTSARSRSRGRRPRRVDLSRNLPLGCARGGMYTGRQGDGRGKRQSMQRSVAEFASVMLRGTSRRNQRGCPTPRPRRWRCMGRTSCRRRSLRSPRLSPSRCRRARNQRS